MENLDVIEKGKIIKELEDIAESLRKINKRDQSFAESVMRNMEEKWEEMRTADSAEMQTRVLIITLIVLIISTVVDIYLRLKGF